MPVILPQLVGNDGVGALRAAIVDPEGWAAGPKVDGVVRGLVVFQADRSSETRNGRGVPHEGLDEAAYLEAS